MFLEKHITLFIGCLETLFYGGVIFGWPSLVFVLKDIGYYADDCPQRTSLEDIITTDTAPSVQTSAQSEDLLVQENKSPVSNDSSSVTCASQDANLQLVFSVAIACQLFFFFPIGILFDLLGTRFTRIFFSILLLTGNLLMAFSSPELPGLLYPGTILAVAGGTATIICNMEIGNLFPSHKSTAIAALQGLYGSAQIVFLIIKVAYEAGFSMHTTFFIIAGFTLLLNVNTFVFLPAYHIPWPLPEGYTLVQCCPSSSKATPTATPTSGLYNKAYVVDGERAERRSLSDIFKDYMNSTNVDEHKMTSENNNDSSARRAPSPLSPSSPTPHQTTEYTTFKSCILSATFWAILMWQAVLELDVIFAFGVFNYFLTTLADGDTGDVSFYTNIFIVTQLTAIVLGPLGGLVVDRNKIGQCKKGRRERNHHDDVIDCCLPLALSSLLCASYSGIFLIPRLEIQYLAYMLITFFRVFFFGTGPVVVSTVFPQKFFGRIYGVIRTITGLVTLLQYPIFIVIQEYLDDDPFYVMIGFCVADILTLFLPAFLYIRTKREKKHLDQACRRDETNFTPEGLPDKSLDSKILNMESISMHIR